LKRWEIDRECYICRQKVPEDDIWTIMFVRDDSERHFLCDACKRDLEKEIIRMRWRLGGKDRWI